MARAAAARFAASSRRALAVRSSARAFPTSESSRSTSSRCWSRRAVGVGQGAFVWAQPSMAGNSAAAIQRAVRGQGDAQKPTAGRNLAAAVRAFVGAPEGAG